jgi:amidase
MWQVEIKKVHICCYYSETYLLLGSRAYISRSVISSKTSFDGKPSARFFCWLYQQTTDSLLDGIDYLAIHGLFWKDHNNMTWQEIGEKARARLDASIPSEWRIPKDKMPAAERADVMDVPFLSGLFSEREILITTSSATHIVDVVAKGEWKAQEVARAFCKRAAVAHQLVRRFVDGTKDRDLVF